MVTVNGRKIDYYPGMTVLDALKKADITLDTMTLVIVDEKVISVDQISRELLSDGAKIKLMPIISGG